MPATPAPHSLILENFIRSGLIDPRSRIEVRGEANIAIIYLRATHPHAGAGRQFLRALKQAGLHIHIVHPTREALPFWRRMNAEHLVDDDPDQLPTWNDFLGALECQMKKPFAEDEKT